MKFYKITQPDYKELGDSVQVESMTEDYDRTSNGSYNLLPTNKEIKVIPNFDALLLTKNARLTDWISAIVPFSSSIFFIASQRMTKLILNHNCSKELQVFDAKVEQNSVLYSYKCLYSYDRSMSLIDFEKITFDKVDIISKKIFEKLSILDSTEFDKITLKGLTDKERPYKLVPNKISLKKNIPLDFFRIGIAPYGYFVSERLKESIVSHDFSGIAFTSLEELG